MFTLFIDAAWKVVVAGVVLGAGLPILFGLGVRFAAEGSGAATAGTAPGSPGSASAPRSAYTVLGVVCFAVVAIAIALGITEVVAAGFGQTLSFANVYPTIVPKS